MEKYKLREKSTILSFYKWAPIMTVDCLAPDNNCGQDREDGSQEIWTVGYWMRCPSGCLFQLKTRWGLSCSQIDPVPKICFIIWNNTIAYIQMKISILWSG